MRKAQKLWLCCMGLGLAAGIGSAQAADTGNILFKIHDITPVRNSEGLVTSCDLGATFYSRLGSEVSNASLRLIWTDDVVNDAISQEEREQKEASRLRRASSRYTTADYNNKNIVLNLKLPPVKPQQQVTLKTKVNTDRCFLLLNDMEIDITNCGTAASGNSLSKNNVNCANLFRFVSIKDPEYYTEFQAVSLEDLKKQEQEQLVEQKNEIDKAYSEAVEAVNVLTKELSAESPKK